GIVASSFSFRLISPELAGEFRLYVPDLRVAGADASLKGTASRVLQLLDHAGVQAADVLASSHGGAVAMELSAMDPRRVRRLILVSPANPFARGYQRVVSFYLSRPGAVF